MSNLQLGFLIVSVILVFLSAVFSAAETAYSTINHVKFDHDIKAGKRIAKLIKKQYQSFGWTLATIILSNGVVNVGLSTISAYLFSTWLGEGATSAIITTAIITPILVVFGEITPKLFAKKYAYSYLKKIAYVLQLLNFLFWPLTFPISRITINSKVTNTETDLASLIDIAKKEKVLEANEATLAQKALWLDSTIVSNVMIRNKQIVWIKADSNVLAAKKVFNKSGHSRILVKKANKYIGLLLLKDITLAEDQEDIKKYLQSITFVTANKLISRAFEKMRIARTHIALVLKNKKSQQVVGLITFEDIIEELVGEIYDEHDAKQDVREISHFKYVTEGSTSIKTLAKKLNFKFEGMNNLTVRQWVQSRIQRRIKKGLRYEYKEKIIFKIIENKRCKETLIEIIIK